MANKPDDRRILFTKSLLHHSLLALLVSKKLSEIKVQELCKHANLNRGTFYYHYEDIYALFREIESELYDEISAKLAEYSDTPDTRVLLTRVFTLIDSKKELCRILCGENGDSDFLSRMTLIAHKNFKRNWIAENPCLESEGDYIYYFIVNGTVGIIKRWVSNPENYSVDEVISVVNNLVSCLRHYKHV